MDLMKLNEDLSKIMVDLMRAIAEARSRKALDEGALMDLVSAHSLIDKALVSMVARGVLDPKEVEETFSQMETFLKEEAKERK